MRIPKYRRHSTNRAFVEFKGDRTYLPGSYDSPESREAYRLFLVNNVFIAPTTATLLAYPDDSPLSVSQLLEQYLERYAVFRYDPTNASSQYHHLRRVALVVNQVCGELPANDFSPRWLKKVQAKFCEPKPREDKEPFIPTRTYVNQQVERVRRMFRWGVAEELIDANVYYALKAVGPVQPGMLQIREGSKRTDTPWEHVSKALPFLSPTVRAMIMLQWWTGARSENVCFLRPREINRSDKVWVWIPEDHKMAWRGTQIFIFIGPKGQKQLASFLDRDPNAFCFNPRESARWISAERARKSTTIKYGQLKHRKPSLSWRLRDHYDPRSYCQTVKRAQKKAGVPAWSPHQLRHSRGTIVAEKYDMEAAQAVLQHATLDSTKFYLHKSLRVARKVAEESG